MLDGWMNVAFLIVGSLIWSVMNLVAFHANKHSDIGVFTVINNISPVFTISIAVAFLGESLSMTQYVGIVLLIFSWILATSTQIKQNKHSELLGVGLSLLAATLLGIAVAYERFMLTRIDFGAYIIYGWGSQIL